MSFDFLFAPVEDMDAWLTGAFESAPLLAALGLAMTLGLRHASDPDHLVALASLVVAERGETRAAVRLGASWGFGHAAMLLAVGLPLIALRSELPGWLEAGAEIAVGLVVLALAGRLIWSWTRGARREGAPVRQVRTTRQAFGIGLLHGLAGTGAVVLMLIAALPTQLEAAAALALFAPMSMLSMAGLTGAFGWLLAKPASEPVVHTVLIPALGLFGLLFGLWYAGLVL
jgi:hypothetical protein